MVLMPRSFGLLLSIGLISLVAACPASAQVINGESTYGDSDLHQVPAKAEPAADTTRRDARPKPPQAVERR